MEASFSIFSLYSAPKGRKFITCLSCTFDDGVLSALKDDLRELSFDGLNRFPLSVP